MPVAEPVVATAYWIAAARARESSRPDRLFDDPFAAELAGERGREMLRSTERGFGRPSDFIPVRTRFFDDLLVDWVVDRPGPAQVVLLGAGLDTRAFRLPLHGAHVVEVDDAALLAAKDAVLDRLGARPRATRTVLGADVLDAVRLVDADVRTLWLAEGLLLYLGAPEVDELLRRTAAPGNRFAADVMGTGLLRQPQLRTARERRAELGLPPPFTADRPAEVFAAAGWPSVRVENPDAVQRRYGRPAPVRSPAADSTIRSCLVVADG